MRFSNCILLLLLIFLTLFAFRPVDPCFILVGNGRPPQSNRMAQIHDVFENITDRRTRPRTRMQRIAPLVRFSGLLKVVICGCQNLLFCQNPRNLTRTFPSSTGGVQLQVLHLRQERQNRLHCAPHPGM